MVAATIRKIHAKNQLAAVFEVSGSPLENFVGLDTAHQPQDGPDGVAQLSGGIEIRGHETGRRVDTGKALTLALRKNTGGNNRTHHRKKDSSLHCRII